MSVINFTVTKPFEKKINEAIKTHGFSSKAEFFRFAAFRFVEDLKASHTSDEEEYERSMKALSTRLKKKYSKKAPPSLEDQLADLR